MSSTRKTLEHIIPMYSLLQDAVAAAEAAAAEAAAAEAAAAEAAAAGEAAEAAEAAVCRGDAAASASLEHGSYFPSAIDGAVANPHIY
jgi:chemosensory pili system protein ChpA (sensor histidine kinase/response regulator)